MKKIFLNFLLLTTVVFYWVCVSAQSIPVKIVNHTNLPDDSIYVAITGQNIDASKFIWIDLENGNQILMDTSYNTLIRPGDTISKFADCFYQLSEINDHTITLERIIGCRIWISEKSHLWFHFFPNLPNTTQGYTQPNILDTLDPNHGIIYEYIECTSVSNGFFGNTTRVDAYQRPISLELIKEGTDSQILGDKATQSDVINRFSELIEDHPEFAYCLDTLHGTILQFTKTQEFYNQGVGNNYYESYIDAIWEKYKTDSLKFDGGQDLGIFHGAVNVLDKFVFRCVSGPNKDSIGSIEAKPTTQEIIEGSGVLATGTITDMNVQKMICAALTRGAIDTTTTAVQQWNDTSSYYKTSPVNHYAGFWHQPGISFDRKAYGFAYDDVFQQSSSLYSNNPDTIKIHFGHYMGGVTSVSELKQRKSLKVYPSFTSNTCTVSGLDKGVLLNVIGLNGQVIETIKLNPNLDKVDLDLNYFSNGLYIIQVISKNRIDITKVIRR